MEESTKILLAAAAGALGLILGFMAAFFAEPIRQAWRNRQSVRSLKKALYQELAFNYLVLRGYLNAYEQGGAALLPSTNHFGIQTRYYEQLLGEEWGQFSQLPESGEIGHLYTLYLLGLKNADALLKTQLGEAVSPEKRQELLQAVAENYVNEVARDLYLGRLDRLLLQNLLTRSDFRELLKRGKGLAGRRSSARSWKLLDAKITSLTK